MREAIEAFFESAAEVLDLTGPVYEFGYSRVSGSPQGALSPGGISAVGYLGEWAHGGQVDAFEDLARLPYPEGVAGTVLVTDVLEHVEKPSRVVREMLRILAPGGLLLLTVTAGSVVPRERERRHRPTPRAIHRLLRGMDVTLLGWQGANAFPHTMVALATKAPGVVGVLDKMALFLECFERRFTDALRHVRPTWSWGRRWLGWLRSTEARRAEEDFFQTHFFLESSQRREVSHPLLVPKLP